MGPDRRAEGTLRGSLASGLVTEAAGVPGLRLHDLRHSAAERMIRSGASLRVVGEVLGHTRAETSKRYAHVAQDVAREVVERMNASVTAKGSANFRKLRETSSGR